MTPPHMEASDLSRSSWSTQLVVNEITRTPSHAVASSGITSSNTPLRV
jgi:hypothetical protein